jgi:hypothetical protein
VLAGKPHSCEATRVGAKSLIGIRNGPRAWKRPPGRSDGDVLPRHDTGGYPGFVLGPSKYGVLLWFDARTAVMGW